MPLMNLPEDQHKAGFLKAVKKFKVTEEELKEGFWRAYADHYTPQSGIEFRHIYKHVQKIREEEPKNTKAKLWSTY